MTEQIPRTPSEQIQPEVISVTTKKSPLLVVLLAVLGLLVVAGAVYAAFEMGKKQTKPNVISEPTIAPQTNEVSPTPDETANWKTYTNTKFSYSLKYPTDWNLVIKGNLDPQTAEGPNFIAPCNFEGGDNCPFFQVDSNFAAYNQQSTLEDYFVYDPKTTQILNKLPLVIDGEKALTMETFVSNWSEGMVNLDTKMIHNKTLFTFSYREENKNQSQIKTSVNFKSKQVFDQILSTFKFTSATSDETKDWKTYTNTTYGFSLKYPTELRVSSNGDFAADFVDQNVKEITPSDIKVRVSVSQDSSNFERIYSAANNEVIPEEQHAQDATFTKVKNLMIGGYKAVSYTYNVPGNQTEKSYNTGILINKSGIIIFISTSETDTTVYNQILSAFKFTN